MQDIAAATIPRQFRHNIQMAAAILIMMQVFKTAGASSQENAFQFIGHNLDILGFVIGMMVLIGIVRESGFFEALAI